MASLNQCNFIGNCGDAPEVRSFQDGGKIATVRIAVSERYTDRAGQTKETTEWVTCVFNSKLADVAAQYLTKGTSIFVSGKLRTRSWDDQQGGKHYATELNVLTLQILTPRSQAAPQAQAPAPAPQYQQAPPSQGYAPQAMPPQAPAAPQYRQAPAPPQAPVPPAPPQYQQPGAPLPPMNSPAYTDPNVGDLPF